MKTEEAEKILKFIADGLVDTKEFALSQAPDLVQQLILWKRTESIMFIALFLIVGIALFIISRSVWGDSKKIEDNMERYDAKLASIVCGLLSFICGVLTVHIIFSYLSVWIAPKIYILDYCANMLK